MSFFYFTFLLPVSSCDGKVPGLLNEKPMNDETFQIVLLDWFNAKGRDLPWRHSYDPYHVWISEVMLQQTQVKYGGPAFIPILRLQFNHFFLNQYKNPPRIGQKVFQISNLFNHLGIFVKYLFSFQKKFFNLF